MPDYTRKLPVGIVISSPNPMGSMRILTRVFALSGLRDNFRSVTTSKWINLSLRIARKTCDKSLQVTKPLFECSKDIVYAKTPQEV